RTRPRSAAGSPGRCRAAARGRWRSAGPPPARPAPARSATSTGRGSRGTTAESRRTAARASSRGLLQPDVSVRYRVVRFERQVARLRRLVDLPPAVRPLGQRLGPLLRLARQRGRDVAELQYDLRRRAAVGVRLLVLAD